MNRVLIAGTGPDPHHIYSGCVLALEALGLEPFLYAGMCLGEGTGAVASIPLWDMARAVYAESYSFAQCGVEAYQPQGG